MTTPKQTSAARDAGQLRLDANNLEKHASRHGYSGVEDRCKAAELRKQADALDAAPAMQGANIGQRVICNAGRNKGKRGTVANLREGNRVDVDYDDKTSAENRKLSGFKTL